MNMYRTSTILLKCIQRAKTIYLYKSRLNLTFPTTSSLCRQISIVSNKFTTVSNDAPGSELDYTSKYTQYLSKINSVDQVDLNHMLGDDNQTFLNQIHRLLLLQFCGKALCNKPIEFRKDLCEKIWAQFPQEALDILDYHAYLQVCTENETPIDQTQFISTMNCEPNKETFRLLLENSCVRGDLETAMKILVAMKEKDFTIDEEIFNLLVLCHTINNGLEGSQGVLATMRIAQVPETSDTHWCILRGLAKCESGKEFFEALENPLLKFDSQHFFEVLLALGINSKHMWLIEMKRQFDFHLLPKNLHIDLEHVCLDLIYRGRAEIAAEIYCDLVESNNEIGFARFLLEEIFSVNLDVRSIKNIIQYLINFNKNPLALEEATELALKNNQMNTALELFADFKVLRPHYFWPIFLHANNERGEVGIISTLKKMLALNTPIDNDTLEFYCFPYCDLSNPKRLLNRLEGISLTMRQLLSPMVVVLLQNNDIKCASELCREFELSEPNPRLLKTLAIAWYNTKVVTDTAVILRSIYESSLKSTDPVGTFLLRALRLCRRGDQDFLHFFKLLKTAKIEKLYISTTSAENLSNKLINCSSSHKSSILDTIEDLLDITILEDAGTIKHPRHMNVEELECHYIELTNKNMETRGVLRRLLQEHSRLGNHERVQELQQAFNKLGYDESPGMQSGVLKGYITNKQLDNAINAFFKLKTQYPSFKIDEYKVIDLAELMVEENSFDEAISLLSEYRKDNTIQGGSYIQRNCCRLIGSAKNPNQAQKLLHLLVDGGYCSANNVILGPVVRAYLKSNDIEGAVAFYTDCMRKYKCTPLKQELMDAVLSAKNEDLLQKIVKVSTKVHGDTNTKLTLIAALAEKGMSQSLYKLFTEIKHIPESELQQQYQRWIQQDKLVPLETLSGVVSRLTILDLNAIHLAIMHIYSKRNDCDGALAFVKKLQDEEVEVAESVKKELQTLLKRCRYPSSKRSSASNVS